MQATSTAHGCANTLIPYTQNAKKKPKAPDQKEDDQDTQKADGAGGKDGQDAAQPENDQEHSPPLVSAVLASFSASDQ